MIVLEAELILRSNMRLGLNDLLSLLRQVHTVALEASEGTDTLKLASFQSVFDALQ